MTKSKKIKSPSPHTEGCLRAGWCEDHRTVHPFPKPNKNWEKTILDLGKTNNNYSESPVMRYPNECSNYNDDYHSHPDGEVCHHDDGFLCEHRAKWIVEYVRSLLHQTREEISSEERAKWIRKKQERERRYRNAHREKMRAIWRKSSKKYNMTHKKERREQRQRLKGGGK